MKRASRLLAVLCVALFSVQMSGCFGQFSLTRKMWEFNKNVSGNKFLQWAVFLVMIVLPVYGIGAFIDALVINSIEFWTGSNPVASAEGPDSNTRVVQLSPEETLRLTRDEAAGVMKVEVLRAGQAPLVRYFELLDDGMAVRDEGGTLVMQARGQADGSVTVSDAAGTTVAMHSAEAVEQARQVFLTEGAPGMAQYARSQVSPLAQGLAQACTP